MTGAAARVPLWRQIRDVLAAEIAEGRYRAGDRLPSEMRLAQRFGVNRHTLRRALGTLAAEGLVLVRRGAGTRVTGRQVSYRIGARPRFGANLRGAGLVPGIVYVRLETLRAGAAEAEALALGRNDLVHVVEHVGLADGLPVAYGISAFPAERFPGLLTDLPATRSVTEALRRGGVADYTRLYTRLSAEAARGAVARHLACAEGAALLRTVSVNIDEGGAPVEYGRNWFVSDRVHLVIDRESLAGPAPAMAAEGPSLS